MNNMTNSESWAKMPMYMQIGNIGSEVNRTFNRKQKALEESCEKAEELCQVSFERSISLMNLMIDTYRPDNLFLKELCRMKELVCEIIVNDNYTENIPHIKKYFNDHVLLFRAKEAS